MALSMPAKAESLELEAITRTSAETEQPQAADGSTSVCVMSHAIESLPDEFTRNELVSDLRTLAYRVAISTPRIAEWAHGRKVSVRAGLYVSRAKSVAAYAIYLGYSTQVAVDVVKQLNATDPSRSDYRNFIESVNVMLTELSDQLDSQTSVEVR